MKSLGFVLALLLAFGFTTPPDVKLEYQFKTGDVYSWVQTTKQTIKQSVMGMDQNMDNSYEGEMQLKIAELTSTGAKIETQFKKLKNSVKSPMGETVMDSEGTAETTENKIFKAMINKPFFLFMNKRGEIEKLEGVDNLWSGLKDVGLDENAQKAMKQTLEQFLGESALRATFEQVLVAYPDKKVKQGDKWTVKNNVAMNFPMTLENTWNIENLSPSDARLFADGLFATTDKEQQISLPGGFKAKADLAGKQALKSNVNVKTGWPTKLEILSELKGKMILLAGGMIPQDMDVPMEVLSETTYVINKK